MSQKQELKQLKQPDEFQVVAGQAMEWLISNKNLVLGVLGAFAAVVLGLWALSTYNESQEAKAGASLASALEIASRPIKGEGTIPAGQEWFDNKEGRDLATAAALEKTRSTFPGSNAARTAAAQLGFLKLRMGDAATAVTMFTEFLDKAPKDDSLRSNVVLALGTAQEKLGKFDDAKATYAKLTELGLPEQAEYQTARLLLVQGKPEAKEALEKVAKDYPKDGVAMDAQRRLELAALPPPPPPGATPAPETPATPAPAPKGKAAPKAPAAPASKAKAAAKKG
ncbi:MAG: tetratricopeptide repeat protein [Deltaproteobacteria bacterium]|nr:tetratricopeptide repeat protein [Deltaproteobacteria bacterium]